MGGKVSNEKYSSIVLGLSKSNSREKITRSKCTRENEDSAFSPR